MELRRRCTVNNYTNIGQHFPIHNFVITMFWITIYDGVSSKADVSWVNRIECKFGQRPLGVASITYKMSYHKISQSLKASRSDVFWKYAIILKSSVMALQIRHNMMISRGVPGLTTDSPRGLWGRGWTTCLLYDEILFVIHIFSFTKKHLKMSSETWRPFFSRDHCLNG